MRKISSFMIWLLSKLLSFTLTLCSDDLNGALWLKDLLWIMDSLNHENNLFKTILDFCLSPELHFISISVQKYVLFVGLYDGNKRLDVF